MYQAGREHGGKAHMFIVTLVPLLTPTSLVLSLLISVSRGNFIFTNLGQCNEHWEQEGAGLAASLETKEEISQGWTKVVWDST